MVFLVFVNVQVYTMIAASKEKINRDNARSHKNERDMPHRVCPSKLTKQELEDLYFVLMDTNLELKKTVNTQQDNIKQLNTKMHRLMTAQKGSMKEQCCPQTKAVVNEQKDIIADLKKANDRMSDRIRILNMRLGSAKQFLKSNQSLSNARCAKCCIAPPASLKNSSVSVLHNKKNESEYKPAENCSRDGDKHVVTRVYVPTRTTETVTDEPEKESPDACCKENKCKTQMEELKRKIIDLQEESSRYHKEYSARISRLESDMSELHSENERVKLERAATLQSLALKAESEAQLAAKLRAADAHCNEVSSQLLMEKNKVAELETRVKAADLASQVAKALEKRSSITFVGPDSQQQSGGLAVREGEAQPSTSTSVVHMQDKNLKNADALMTKETEDRPSTSYIHMQDKKRKSSDAISTKETEDRPSTSYVHMQDKNLKSADTLMTKEIMNRPSTSYIHTQNRNLKSADTLMTKEIQNRPSTSYIHTQDKNRKSSNEIMTKETDNRPSASYIDQNTQPKSGDSIDRDGGRRHSITFVENQMTQTKSGEQTRDGEKRQSISFLLDPNTPPKSEITIAQNDERKSSINLVPNSPRDDIMPKNEDRKLSVHCGTTPISGDRMAKDAEMRQSMSIQREPLPERTLSEGESLKLEPSTQNQEHRFSGHRDSVPGRTLSVGDNLKFQESEVLSSPSITREKPCPICEKGRQTQDASPGVANSPSYVILGNANTPSPAKSKHSDDSGYNDTPTSEEEKVLAKINSELVKKIQDLQEKLDLLRVASAGLKAEQMSRATETKKADVDPKTDIGVKNEKVFPINSKTSRDFKDATVQGVENERKKESPEQPTKETESPEYSPIDRANQLWAQYSGNTLPPKEDKIQFSNSYRQFNSVDKIIPTPCEADPDKDSMASRCSRKKRLDRKKLLDDKYVDTQNELVDKIEMHDGLTGYKDSRPDFPFYEFKAAKSQFMIQDDKLRDSFTTDNVKATDDNKHDSNTRTDDKTGIKIHDTDTFRHEGFSANDLEQDLMQTDIKTGVKIQENDVFRPVDKPDRMRTRDSIIDKTVRDKINEIRNLYKDKQQRNASDDDSVALQSSSEFCEQSVRVCSCPRAPRRRSVSVFRSCSGTLRFKTTDTEDTFRQCRSCTPDANDDDPRTCNDAPLVCKSIADDARPRTASPDNTDHEISHLSDLPPEHDGSGKSPRRLISPGEHKTATTCTTDTCTETTSEMPTMSEGEVLVSSGCRRRSIGETKDEAVGTKAYKEAATVSQMMEQALQSIGEELARCRELLQNTRSPEIALETRETSTTCPSRVALKHSAATPQLVLPSSAPCKCTFTLHIGTLVLSDEAVVYSRDKSLLLTWKFFDQNVAMTRVRGGRVILFDFTTEYDAVLDERFTDYLKYEEMPIVICELEKQNFPFATCALPFRDVLLNPNHRVDMSLALTVGPDMRKADVPISMDSLVTSDEVGVLDLWCMLRNKMSFSEATKPTPPRDSGNAMMDIRSEEFGMSMDDKFSQAAVAKRAGTTGSTQHDDDGSLAKFEVHNNRLSSVIPHEVPTKIRRPGEMEKAIDEKRNEAQSQESIKGLEKLEQDVLSHQPHQSVSSWARFLRRQSRFQTNTNNNKKSRKNSLSSTEHLEVMKNSYKTHAKTHRRRSSELDEPLIEQGDDKEFQQKKAVTMNVPMYSQYGWEQPQREADKSSVLSKDSIVITILWLALNEECGAMTDSAVQRLYVAFSVLGRSGADLETPISLPKPRSYVEKCIFNFRKSIQLRQCDLPQLGHLGRCTSSETRRHNPKDCIVFTVISEPAEDPLGLASCEDIGYAYLYLGDVLSASDSETYVEVIPVHSARRDDVVCGVLCVQVDGLELVRKAKLVNVAQ